MAKRVNFANNHSIVFIDNHSGELYYAEALFHRLIVYQSLSKSVYTQ